MTEPTTRTQILSGLAHPDWNPTSEAYGIGHDAATALVDRYTAETRAAAYREAADLAASNVTCSCSTCQARKVFAAVLRGKADEIDPA